MFDSTKVYIKMAEGYDPEIPNDSLVQAARNVWTCFSLQLLLLKQEAAMNYAILGYSLLYPYSDNYLDDSSVDRPKKYAFQKTFGDWLEGIYEVEPSTPTERKVYDQVRFVEKEFPRPENPNVFHSMTAINDAQTASLRQHENISDSELLTTTVFKGGTSVLADLFMVAGSNPSEEDQIFSFSLGFALQLVDDIQDIIEDSKNKHHTTFTRSLERKQYADLLVLRLIYLLDWTINPKFWKVKNTSDIAMAIRKQMLRMCTSIVMKSIAQSPQLFSSDFVRKHYCYSPFPLQALKEEKSMKHILEVVRKDTI